MNGPLEASGQVAVGGLTAVDWTIMVVYLVGLVWMSYKLGEDQESVQDYYLGGNKLAWWAIGISTMSTQLSTNSMLGIPAFVALDPMGGMSALQTELALPLAILCIMAFMHPFFRHAGVISVYEYLELRFGVATRTVLSVLFQLSRALATGVTVYSVSLVFEKALGIDLWISIFLIGIVTVIYDTLGGMAAVVWSDVIQMGIIFSGVVLCLWYAYDLSGGAAIILSTFEPERFRVLLTDQSGLGEGQDYSFWAMLFGFFFLYASYYGCDQSQVQRQLSAKDIDDARLSLFLNGMLRFVMILLLSITGLAVGSVILRDASFMSSLAVDGTRQNQMMIHFVLHYLPVGVRGLIVVAVFSAAMSSLDSAINSLSATTMRDLYERFVDPEPDEGTHIYWSKILTVFWGTFCTAAAFLTPYMGDNVLIVINKVGSIMYGPILGAFLLALFTRRTNDLGALLGVVAGVLGNLALAAFTDVSWLWWNVAGCLLTMGAGWILSHAGPAPRDEDLHDLVYRPGIEQVFDCKRNWNLYYGALVLAFVAFMGISFAIEQLVAGQV